MPNSGGFGTIAAVGLGLLGLYLVLKSIPPIQIPVPTGPAS